MSNASSEGRQVVAWLQPVRWIRCSALWAVLAVVWLFPHLDLSLRGIRVLGLIVAICHTFGLNPGLVRTNIRDNFFGKDTLKSRFMEAIIGLLTPSPQTYAERLAPLLVSRDLDGHNGAMFDRKGNAILPSPKLMDASYRDAFIADSEALVAARASLRLSG